MDDSYFSHTVMASDEGSRRPSARDDSVEDMFVLSGCNTPMESASGVDTFDTSPGAHVSPVEKGRRGLNNSTCFGPSL
jgi:hypothetical protein